jgi:NADPH2:quinone reductase
MSLLTGQGCATITPRGVVSIRALIVDPSAPEALRLAAVAEPQAGPSQVVIDVRHVSLNYGDLNDARSGRVPAGAVLGSDAAGVVVQAAADGGPGVGARVVALAPGAFAERAAVDAGAVAEVPPSVDLAEAATLPVAGLAALRRRVLITGASGGVGRFAVQLAARAGAHVIASVGSLARGEGLDEAGAEEVVVGLEGLDQPVDVVLDNVGGPRLVEAWHLLAPGGNLQSIGWTSGEPAVFDPYSTVGPAKSLSTSGSPVRIWPRSWTSSPTAPSASRSAGAERGTGSTKRPERSADGAYGARRYSTWARRGSRSAVRPSGCRPDR